MQGAAFALPARPPLRGAFFDFDGTLVQSEDAHRRRFAQVLGLEISPDDLTILSMVPGSQADCYGVPPRVKIVAVDGEAVTSYDDFLARRGDELRTMPVPRIAREYRRLARG